MAGVLLVLAGVVVVLYTGRHAAIRDERLDYKAMYDKYAELPKARVVTNDLRVKELENGGIAAGSRMNVVNRNEGNVPFILYLNPGLVVKSFEIDGSAVAFRREYQALIAERELAPGESCSVEVRYEGKIDNAVCFLDVHASRYDAPDVNRNGMYHYGYKPAICEREYKLLTPECMWYPACLPSYSSTGYRGVHFTRYTLEVEHDARRTAVSQGDATRADGVTSFAVGHDMAGISLCLGEYEKKEITLFSQIPDDTTRVEMYFLSRHGYLLDKYDLPNEKIAEGIGYYKGNLEVKECLMIFP